MSRSSLTRHMAVYSWGRGEDGQLGLGDTTDQYKPVIIEALLDKGIVQVACGSGHTVVLSEEGEMYTWGRGDDGRLGHGDNGWKYVPRLVESLKGRRLRQVTCGSYHTAAVTEDGELYTWGGGMYGKLGHGNESGHSTPCLVEALTGFRVEHVACGSRHTVVLLDNSDVYTWGDRENGVSGHGEVEGHHATPTLVQALRGKEIKQISACGFHTAALSERGDIYTWGEGKFGRLGHKTERNQIIPTIIESLKGKQIAQVTCGGFHTAAITENGETYTWGGGEHGQLGHGDKVNKMIPTLVQKLDEEMVVQVTCGWSHTVALTDKGIVYTWGNGDHGKLGHCDTIKVTVPRQVEALKGKNVVRVTSYNEHTAALVEIGPPRSSMVASVFLDDIRKLLEDDEFSDVTFIVEDQKIHAHRALLSVRSEHFRAMFSSGMRESREQEIVVPSIRNNIFRSLLEYLYTDQVDIHMENVVELYIAADLYTIDRLKSLCEKEMQKLMNIENSSFLLQMADEFHAPRLREQCLKYMTRHFDIVTKTDGFQHLTRDLILEVLQHR